MIGPADLDDRHLSKQYFTSFHTSDRFFRHVNSWTQIRHVLSEQSGFVEALSRLLAHRRQPPRYVRVDCDADRLVALP
jgi:hypothetical protein